MRITRHYTKPGVSPYDGAATGFFVLSRPDAVQPASHCLGDGIAVRLRPVAEDDVPGWLWRHEPDEAALQSLPDHARYCGETGMAEIVDRVAGAWTYHGWKGGYFDTEQDAHAFFDEARWLLRHGIFSPDEAQWRSAGLYWAYGLSAADDDSCVTDYRTGKVRRAEAGDLPPHGLFINGVHDALTGEGGGLDLLRREARLARCGARCGANVSAAMHRGATDYLGMADCAARYALSASGGSAAARRITIDAAHPESAEVLSRRASCLAAAEFAAAGRAVAVRHVEAILDACFNAADRRQATDPGRNPALRLALRSARQAAVPETAIRRALDLAAQKPDAAPADVFSSNRRPAREAPDSAPASVTVVRVTDVDLGDRSVVDGAAAAAWAAGHVGIDFADTIEAWNGCPAAGEIRSASGDGGFLFHDDTAAERATLDATAFTLADGSFDVDGFRRAARLVTLALDISLMTMAVPSPRLARRVWDFRPLALSIAGVGDLLMAMGIPYESDAGRATCAALCALLTGTASLTSSEIAGELGPCPAWPENAPALAAILDARRDAVRDRVAAAPFGLAGEAGALWNKAPVAARHCGLRNACLTAIGETPMQVDRAAPGLSPVPGVIRREPTGTGGWRKTLAPAVPAALGALGYSQAESDAILRHVVGHGTLAHAPGVNHGTLRRRGFTESAIATLEAALADVGELAHIFNRWTLGDSFCRQMLGFTGDELADDEFDMLAALGFSDAGIEAADIFCFGAGTMEGAPHLKPDHLAVFDCAAPQGERGRRCVSREGIVRMMAAAQPFICGGIGHSIEMPEAATIDDCGEMFRLARRLGLKSLVLRGRATGTPAPPHRDDAFVETRPLALVASAGRRVDTTIPAPAGTASRMRAPVPAVRATTPSTDGRPLSDPIDDPASPETVIAADPKAAGGDAETSRSASSLAARSTASVPSSADAVVEQRQV